jgi:hypothetical protein
MDVIVAALSTVCVIAILFVVLLRRRRSKRDSQKEAADPSTPNRFDTTLGEFHEMREALRPCSIRGPKSRSTKVDRDTATLAAASRSLMA